ncbi:MAG: ribonuclease HII [Patescibacteria group bacterium]
MRPQRKTRARYLVGIDEAGRGPLAGPVAVGAVCIDTKDKKAMRALRILGTPLKDSKQLSEKQREERYEALRKISKKGGFFYEVALIGSRTIDSRGITYAIKRGIVSVLRRLPAGLPRTMKVLLDGGLSAPPEYPQQTFIKGDERYLPIAFASIVAKVRRDRIMDAYDIEYPKYHFSRHKGYGTSLHVNMIARHGLSPIHRRTFCTRIRKNSRG